MQTNKLTESSTDSAINWLINQNYQKISIEVARDIIFNAVNAWKQTGKLTAVKSVHSRLREITGSSNGLLETKSFCERYIFIDTVQSSNNLVLSDDILYG
jgi:hypothetical protein